LHRADGTPLGAIGFAWIEPTPFGAKLVDALRAVAHLCTETIERAERYDDEHELIVELQRRLLPDVPTLAGIETAARYLPAGRSASVGGDWFEGLRLGDGRLAVVVGDVTGHGMAAAADMALIRGMITALLHSGVAVADVFSEVSGVVKQRPGLLLATAALVVVDVTSQTLTFATAGHPPPLLVHPGGDVEVLDAANGPMIGLADTALRNAGAASFVPGSQLVMYTDGLVERREQPFDVGVGRARDHLASSAGLSPSQLIDSLLDTLCADQPVDDDIAIVVVENRSESSRHRFRGASSG
jgi:serine phosphatase RsbU (regulator of sigma subunit)